MSRARLRPLYAAGFTTAFGAHGIAATLGVAGDGAGASLLRLGLLLALYDGAEVVLKPAFGTLADRIGPRPVLVGGLVAFVLASGGYVVAARSHGLPDTGWLLAARLGQGAAASAFSPAASALVARLTPETARGRAFGSYGFYKSVGYTIGPFLGGAVVAAGGLRSLFAVMAVLAAAVACWAALTVPRVPPLPRPRQTVGDLIRRIADPGFLRPMTALAAGTGALSVGVGFLPVSGRADGLGPIATGAAVSVLAACSAAAQPLAGRALDAGRIGPVRGLATGLLLCAAAFVLAAVPGVVPLVLAAATAGAGIGLVTPLGFAVLAEATPPERMGQTMGSAEVGREIGDAGGPLVVGAVATALSLASGYLLLAGLLVGAAAYAGRRGRWAA
ncbi:MFS transporter [Microbispora bryophytorum]|uniref:MFS transporter n=1 Tax=Microbispora bryophytorum TaxID=1460882 RepID=UPI00295EC6AC|nr:MFS transporter [Microbispora camponoti]